MKKTLIIFFLSCVFLVFGCLKRGDSVFSGIQTEGVLFSDVWDPSVINGFLAYVPADSAMVYASTRAVALERTAISSHLERYEKLLREKMHVLRHSDDAQVRRFIPIYDALIDLVASYPSVAPDWGLDPKGRTDVIIYATDKKLVAKVSLVDAFKARTKFKALLEVFDELAITDISLDGDTWVVIRDVRHDLFAFALHFGPEMLTLSMNFELGEGLFALKETLKSAAYPIKKEQLGKVEDNTIGVGFIDNVKLHSLGLDPSSDWGQLLRLIDLDQASDFCSSEIQRMVETFPRTEFQINSGNGQIYINSTFKTQRSAIGSDLQSILDQELDIETAKKLASFFVPLDSHTRIKVLTQWDRAFRSSAHRPDKRSNIQANASKLANLSARAKDKGFSFFTGLPSLNISVESIEILKDLDGLTPSSSAISEAFDRPSISVIKGVKALKSFDPANHAVVHFDIGKRFDMPLVPQNYLSDRALEICVDIDIDDSQVSKIKSSAVRDFLRIQIDYNILSLIQEGPKMNYSFDLNIGVVSDGIRLRSIIHF